MLIRDSAEFLDLWANVTVRTLLPAPQIIELTTTVPEPVVGEIRRASTMVWLDTQAAAGALRSAVERVMDDHDIPAKSAKGGRISLGDRLKDFNKATPSAGALLEATKWVGNSGVHDPSQISAQDALDQRRSSRSHSTSSTHETTMRSGRAQIRSTSTRARKRPHKLIGSSGADFRDLVRFRTDRVTRHVPSRGTSAVSSGQATVLPLQLPLRDSSRRVS